MCYQDKTIQLLLFRRIKNILYLVIIHRCLNAFSPALIDNAISWVDSLYKITQKILISKVPRNMVWETLLQAEQISIV